MTEKSIIDIIKDSYDLDACELISSKGCRDGACKKHNDLQSANKLFNEISGEDITSFIEEIVGSREITDRYIEIAQECGSVLEDRYDIEREYNKLFTSSNNDEKLHGVVDPEEVLWVMEKTLKKTQLEEFKKNLVWMLIEYTADIILNEYEESSTKEGKGEVTKTASEYLDSGCDKDDQRDSKGAIEDYTKALELNPKYAEAYANRGCAKEELGDIKEAILDWQKAADLGDTEAALWIKESIEKHNVQYEDLLEIIFDEPDFPEVVNYSGDARNDAAKIREFTKLKLEEYGVSGIKAFSVKDEIIKFVWDKQEKQLLLENQKEKRRGEDWQLKGLNLIAVAKKFSDRADDELAKLFGFYSTSFYQEALQEAKAINSLSTEENSHLVDDYFIYEDSLVCADSEHGGEVYVSKKAIESDPDFYDIKQFDEVTKEFLIDEGEMDEDEIDEILEGFEGVMMRTYISALCFLDGESIDDDEAELKIQGVKYKDVIDEGGLSRWHDG